jgi:teichoic acid transport system permease protein
VSSAETGDPPDLIDIGVVPPVRDYMRRLWERRDFVWAVPIGQLRAQTQSTALGAGWHLLNPLLTAALYYLVFGVIFGGRGRIENYPAFLVVGIFTFLYTSRCVTAGAKSITSNGGLLTTINFPRLALPSAATVAETVSHAFALGALALMVPILSNPPRVTWALVVPALLLQAIFNLGAAMIVARLSFQFRDIETLLPHLLRFWMYLSGLFFTIDLVVDAVGAGSPLVGIFQANPAYLHMALMRGALLDGHEVYAWMWFAAVAWTLVIVVGGFVFFRAHEVEYGRG